MVSLKGSILPVAIRSRGGNQQDAFSLSLELGGTWRGLGFLSSSGWTVVNQARWLTPFGFLENFNQGPRGLFDDTCRYHFYSEGRSITGASVVHSSSEARKNLVLTDHSPL